MHAILNEQQFFENCGFAHPIGMTALKVANFSRSGAIFDVPEVFCVRGMKKRRYRSGTGVEG